MKERKNCVFRHHIALNCRDCCECRTVFYQAAKSELENGKTLKEILKDYGKQFNQNRKF